MSGENPYAAPAVIDESAPPSALAWRMDGTGLLVKTGTVLPPIDLESGASGQDGAELIPVLRRHQSGRGRFLGMLFVAAFVVVANAANANVSGVFPWLLLGYVVLSRFSVFKGSSATLWEHREKRREALRKRRLWFRIGLIIFGPVVMLGSFWIAELGGYDGAALLLGGVAVWLLLLVLAIVLGFTARPRTSLANAGDGWLRLDQLHPDAVTGLFGIEQDERARITAAGGEKSWNVFTVFAQKVPLRLLVDRDTHLWMAMNLWVLRMTRSRQLEMTLLAPDEAEPVPADSLCRELATELAEWRTRHQGWTLLSTERLAAPFCMVAQEFATLVDPGRRHAALLIATWARAKPAAVRCRVQFHAWKPDGHLVATTNQPVIETARSEVSYEEARGSADEVLARHLERCGAGDWLILTPDEIARRIAAERNAAMLALQKLGYYGPLRTVTMTSLQ
jgi:hypothetical protein